MEDRTGDGVGGPANEWFSIEPDDNTDLKVKPRALLIGTAGSLRVKSSRGTIETLPVPVGYNPIRPVRVYATGTSASGIFGLY
jgi:hypothetical protein